MPIYEFYCRTCHTIYSFFSASVGVDAPPACPECDRQRLERRPSTFAMLSGGGDEGEDDEADDFLRGIDEQRLEGAMETLASEMERLGDGDDPRAMGQVFRRFGELTGLELGPRMEEALARMEGGEDLDAIEDDLEGGDDDDLEDFFRFRRRVLSRRSRPRVDQTLHFL